MATRTHNPLRPEIGGRYRLRLYLGGELIAAVLEIDHRRGLIHVRDAASGHDFRWTRALWRRDCIERIG